MSRVERTPSASRMLRLFGKSADFSSLSVRRKKSDRSDRNDRNRSVDLEISGPIELEASSPLGAAFNAGPQSPNERASKRLSAHSDVFTPGAPPTQEIAIAPHGDVILQFENPQQVLQLRVLSSALAASSSGLFARVADLNHVKRLSGPESLRGYLPKLPSRYSESRAANVFIMPQEEYNHLGALEILFNAMHFMNDKLPAEVTFRQLVFIAGVCDRYQCVNPVMQIMMYRWLPQWRDKVGERGFEDWLYISWVFGLKDIFEQTSRQVILDLKSETDMRDKMLPSVVRGQIRQQRAATLARILRECSSLLFSYLHRPPMPVSGDPLTPAPVFRKHHTMCPRGMEHCDATSIGWLMLSFEEFAISNAVLDFATNPHYKEGAWFNHPIGSLLKFLRNLPSPPALHDSLTCDYAPSFRSKMEVITQSVHGLDIALVNQNMPLVPADSESTSSNIGVAKAPEMNVFPTSMDERVQHSVKREMLMRDSLPTRFPPTPPLLYESDGIDSARVRQPGRPWIPSTPVHPIRRWSDSNPPSDSDLTAGLLHSYPQVLSEGNLASLTEETRSVMSSVVSIRGDRCDSPSTSILTRTTIDGSVVTTTAVDINTSITDFEHKLDDLAPNGYNHNDDHWTDRNPKEVIPPAHKEALLKMRADKRKFDESDNNGGEGAATARARSWGDLPEMI